MPGITVLDPTSEETPVARANAARLPSLDGVTVGLLNISKARGDVFLDDELTEIFLEEARELMDSLEASLQAWHGNPEDLEVINDLERTLHTLKGGSLLRAPCRWATSVTPSNLC